MESSTAPLPRSYEDDYWDDQVQICMGECEERTWASEAEETPLLENISRKRLVKALQAREDLACSDL
jgi:hypothetical protein